MSSTQRTAYILQTHKNPEQVNKFIQQLISDDQADVYVHIDKRNFEQIHNKIIKNDQVKVLHQTINCEWGDISQIDTTILLLKEVLSSKKDYDFVCLRSGQDLLVKDGFKDFLNSHQGNIFMALRSVGKHNLGLMEINWPKATRRRYTTPHPNRIYRRVIQSLYRNGFNIYPNTNEWPEEYTFHNGSQWFTMPLDIVKYMIDFIDQNEWYYKYFENTLCPDEWFFHTLIMNSPYKSKVVNNNLLFVKWGEKFSEQSSPQYLTEKDIDSIRNSGHFFARKFDADVDSAVINYFVERITFRRSMETIGH